MTDFENIPDYEECLVTFFDVLGFRNLLLTRSGAEIRHLLSIFRRVSEGDATPPTRSNQLRCESGLRMNGRLHFVLPPVAGELFSSWIAHHAAFYGVPSPTMLQPLPA